MASKTRDRIRAAAEAALLAGDDEAPSEEPDASEASDGPQIPDKLYFRIGEVARIVGVDAHVLRYWESEFKMKPHRSSSGQRLYRKTDLSRFLRIKRLLHDEGYTIAGARRVLSGQSDSPPAGPDPARIKEARDRLESLRHLIQDVRLEILGE